MAGNVWGVPALNRQLLPAAQASVSAMLQRELEVGQVHWVAPTGLLGLTPLGSFGPVRVGPGPVEGSSAEARRVTVAVDPLQSLVHRRVVLSFKAQDAKVCHAAWCSSLRERCQVVKKMSGVTCLPPHLKLVVLQYGIL
jgi:hypothetical protein